MLRVDLNRLVRHGIALLEFTLLKHKERGIEARLEEVVRDLGRLQVVVLGLLNIASSKFEDSEVVEALGVVRIVADRYFESLVGNSKITYPDSDMANVVPDIRGCIIVSHGESSIKAAKCHIILRGVEATEAHVVPKLRVAHSTLDKPPVKP